jgi:hypothetical protein
VFHNLQQSIRSKMERLWELEFSTVEMENVQQMDVEAILGFLGRQESNDQYNCGICGFKNCIEHAWAIKEGRSELDKCLPYLLDYSASYLIAQEREYAKKLERLGAELDAAFALTLPDRQVEDRLRSIVEYEDEYIAEDRIRIVQVIEQGGYLHVVNALKVLATLRAQGVMDVIGIDQETLVKAIIFHDIGKVQPRFRVNDVVNPHQVFESSQSHALRSSWIAENYYHQPPEVVALIKYHHHGEGELEDFPPSLLPMFRLLKLIDGLSAGVTRRRNTWEGKVENTKVILNERNHRVVKEYVVDLYTGEHRILEINPREERQR